MGMQLVGGSAADSPAGASAFLSSRPSEGSHKLVFFTNPALQHVAFKVATLAELRACYQHIVARGVSNQRTRNHGVSLAFYFDDPEGNRIEVYWPIRNIRSETAVSSLANGYAPSEFGGPQRT
jgi:catechol 2,3-dioxygenase-like lactoylglutathione lyase family enzyme